MVKIYTNYTYLTNDDYVNKICTYHKANKKKKRTGKSKEYLTLNLRNIGCPTGRRCTMCRGGGKKSLKKIKGRKKMYHCEMSSYKNDYYLF